MTVVVIGVGRERVNDDEDEDEEEEAVVAEPAASGSTVVSTGLVPATGEARFRSTSAEVRNSYLQLL